MRKSDLIVVCQVLLFVLFLTLGNISWKYGLDKMEGFMTNNFDILYNFKKLIVSPYIWLGALLYGAGTLWWFYLMSKEDISYLYPLASIGYVLTMIAGVLLFNESIPLLRWFGMIFVVIGFIIMAIK